MTEDRAVRWLKLLQVSQADIDQNSLQKWAGELSHPDYVCEVPNKIAKNTR